MTVVFLCLGAAKAGTSWLHAQLRAHPECHFRAIKELHYFDALDGKRLAQEKARHLAEQSQVMARAGDSPSAAQAERLRDRAHWLEVLSQDIEDQDAYLSYLQTGCGEARVVGEITPAYALLSQRRLSQIARMASDVRILYLMRDPIERLWSHVRMIAARRDDNGQVTTRRAGNILKRVFTGDEEQIEKRGDYARAMRKLKATVPEGRLMFGVFEEFVSEGLDRLSEFLGIAPFEADLAPVHSGQPLPMTHDQRMSAERFLRPQYKAVERELGRVPESWHWKG